MLRLCGLHERDLREANTFSDDIFKHIFSDKNVGISIQI